MNLRHVVAVAVRSAAVATLAGLLFVPTAFAQTAEEPATAAEAPAADALPPLSTTLDAAPAIDPVTGLPVAPAQPAIDPLTGLPVAASAPAVDPVTGLPIEEEDLAAEETENPYSFQHMWETGDIVARSTLITMIIMSAASWYIIVTKSIEQTRLMGYARRLSSFWSAPTVGEGLNRLGARNPYRTLATAADIESRPRAEGIAGQIATRRRAEIDLGRAIEALNVRLQGGMAVLATVGATAPFVGLLGTVWGIRNALIELGLSGEPSIERIAGPVGEALLMTAIGLIVAVPAVFLYNVLGRRNKKVIDTARGFAADVDALIIAQAA